MNPKNMGVAANIPRCLEKVLFDSNCYDHHSTYHSGKLYEHVSETINPLIEEDNTVLTDELSKYYELN